MHSTKIEKVQIFLPGLRLANRCFTMHGKKRKKTLRRGGKLGREKINMTLNSTQKRSNKKWATVSLDNSLSVSGESSCDQATEASDQPQQKHVIVKHWADWVAGERKHLECTSTQPSVGDGSGRVGSGRDRCCGAWRPERDVRLQDCLVKHNVGTLKWRT